MIRMKGANLVSRPLHIYKPKPLALPIDVLFRLHEA